MNFFLRAGLRRLLGVAVLAAMAAPAAVAQCPITATCTPGNASGQAAFLQALQLGIFNVTLGTINNTTLGYADGYRDYSCTVGTTLNVGQTYTLSVQTSATAGATERVSAWIDYDNDGIFNTTTEVIMSGVVNVSPSRLHTVTFAAPAGAVLSVPLRMRVASDYSNSPAPGPCTTPVYSQTEDYAVTLSANSSPPTAVFTTNGTTTCSGCVQFTDASQNVPTSWSWNFGDGSALDTQQNPNHCFANPGTYSVVLTTTNAAGTATSTPTTITYNSVVPVAASCSPGTTTYFGGYGVTRFRLNTIDNTSADGSAGYQDFTCPQQTRLVAGNSYSMTITTGGTNQHAIRVYIDSSNNGIFEASEQVYENLTAPAGGVTATIVAPASAVTNQPLRLRVVADFVSANLGACTTRTNGQDEDYTVIIGPITTVPTVDFTSNYVAGGCVNPIQFTDQSTGLDASTTWLWNFGDNQTSTTQNPSHQYATSGTYTVSLTVTNAIGTAAITKTSYATIRIPCFSYCAANGSGGGMPGGPPTVSNFFINNVAITAANTDPAVPSVTYPAFSNASGNSTSPIGYTDFSGLTATLRIGQQHTMTVVSNNAFTHRTTVWIDLRHDGIFDNDDRVVNYSPTGGMPVATHVQTFTLSANGVPGLAAAMTGHTRMRVIVVANNNAPNPCGTNIQNAEVEDYDVEILPAITASTREAGALPSLTVYPNPSQDGHLHLSVDYATAGTYTATVQNMLGATLRETTLRLLPGADAELDLSKLAKGMYMLRLRDAQGHTALRRIVRE